MTKGQSCEDHEEEKTPHSSAGTWLYPLIPSRVKSWNSSGFLTDVLFIQQGPALRDFGKTQEGETQAKKQRLQKQKVSFVYYKFTNYLIS